METLEFLEIFFQKLTISGDSKEYEEKVQRGKDLKGITLNQNEMNTLAILLKDYGFNFSLFIFNNFRSTFFHI